VEIRVKNPGNDPGSRSVLSLAANRIVCGVSRTRALWSVSSPRTDTTLRHAQEKAVLACKIPVKADFEAEWFAAWRPLMRSTCANGIHLGDGFRHRKEWEFVAVCQALAERGCLEPGKRGIGFGVGTEPLPAIFASRQCNILATDCFDDPDSPWRHDWAKDNNKLCRPDICPPELFARHVEVRSVDMRAIPSDVAGFDFSWSCCALEHLGSLKKGFDFIVSQLDCLKPGGWAVNTTEFNLSSNQHTFTEGPTVAYRKQDIELLAWGLKELRHHVEPLDFALGEAPEDRFVATPPWDDTTRNIAHLRVPMGSFVRTSLLLIMRKRLKVFPSCQEGATA